MKIFRNWTFKWWEVGMIKIYAALFGVILALYLHDYLIGLIWLWWTLFIVTGLYFIIKLFKKEKITIPE